MVKHKIMPIPDATVGELLGLVEIVYSYGGKVKISFLADELRMEMDDLGDVIDMGELLEAVNVDEGEVTLSLFGEGLTLGTIDNKKKILRDKIKDVEPFKSVIEMLNEEGGKMGEQELLEALAKKFVIEDFAPFRKLLIGWGNYTESFEYDGDEQEFVLKL
jgi:NitT/TauT family transport system ATP-binding protein